MQVQNPQNREQQTRPLPNAVVIPADRTNAYTGPVQASRQPVVPGAQGAPANKTTPSVWASVPLWVLGLAAGAGALLALITIPTWVPVLGASLVGNEPKVSWYLTRASALVAYLLLWVSMASGLLISNKMARIWPGAFTAFDLHQYTSLLGLGFAAFHALILIFNGYIQYSLGAVLIPFASSDYRPVWVALGQIAFYVSILVSFTFYIRKQIGNKVWRGIHLLSYLMFGMALLHGLFSGTDSSNVWIVAMYWVTGVSIIALTIYRVSIAGEKEERSNRQVAQ